MLLSISPPKGGNVAAEEEDAGVLSERAETALLGWKAGKDEDDEDE